MFADFCSEIAGPFAGSTTSLGEAVVASKHVPPTASASIMPTIVKAATLGSFLSQLDGPSSSPGPLLPPPPPSPPPSPPATSPPPSPPAPDDEPLRSRLKQHLDNPDDEPLLSRLKQHLDNPNLIKGWEVDKRKAVGAKRQALRKAARDAKGASRFGDVNESWKQAMEALMVELSAARCGAQRYHLQQPDRHLR